MKPFIVKYDYEDLFGFGTCIVFAEDMDGAIVAFKNHMFDSGNVEWKNHAYNQNNFRWVSRNVFGWNTYFNGPANVCLKIREINTTYGTIIPIQEYFDLDETDLK